MKLSYHPDPCNAWLYDPSHPDYYSERAKDLRARRERAILSAPLWMREIARLNDAKEAQS